MQRSHPVVADGALRLLLSTKAKLKRFPSEIQSRGSGPEAAPRLLVRDLHGRGPRIVRRGKHRQKIQHFRPGVERGVDQARGKVNRVARAQHLLLLLHPLLRLAREDVEDFFHEGVKMEFVRLARGQLGPDKHQIGVLHHPWLVVPEMCFSRQSLHICLGKWDDAPLGRRAFWHGARVKARRPFRQAQSRGFQGIACHLAHF